MASLEQRLKQQAHTLGFELAGIAPATEADGFGRLCDWLDGGFAGTMDYMHRHREARRHPSSILPEVHGVVMVGMNYRPASEPEASASSSPGGRVARYARGRDYHDVLRERLNRLLDWLQQERPDCLGRGVVDTAPLLERDFARRAGLGWFGKNTMLLNKRQGSYFFLGALLVNLELTADRPHTTSHCGTCTACLDACPTAAFTAPGLLDARRCISYLTIEHKGAIAAELRPGLGDWLFGCDVCQEVCPWNRKAPAGAEPALQGRPEWDKLDLLDVLGLSEEEFRRRFRGTALLRTKRRGLLRNAALVLGNTGDATALPALYRAVEDVEPLVREAARWAIEQIIARTRANCGGALSSSQDAVNYRQEHFPKMRCTMVARGRVQNGVVVLDEGVHLPEGQEVIVLEPGTLPTAPSLPGTSPHSILDIPVVSLGPVLYPLTADDDLLGEMLDGRR